MLDGEAYPCQPNTHVPHGAMGLEGIVSKRVESRYRSGLVPVMGEGAEPGV
jgi:hypothetical protein